MASMPPFVWADFLAQVPAALWDDRLNLIAGSVLILAVWAVGRWQRRQQKALQQLEAEVRRMQLHAITSARYAERGKR